MNAVTFGVSLALSLLLVRVVRSLSYQYGRVAQPRSDRWHHKPTATLGGIAIYISALISVFISIYINYGWGYPHWGLLAASSFIFFLGLYDDIRQLTPPAKLIGQLIAASIAIYFGYTTNFFTPKIAGFFIEMAP